MRRQVRGRGKYILIQIIVSDEQPGNVRLEVLYPYHISKCFKLFSIFLVIASKHYIETFQLSPDF